MWSDSSKKTNKVRTVYLVKEKEWINAFNSYDKYLEENQKPLFTPTTIMEIGNHKYVFVIHKAKINSHGNVEFKISTNEIEGSKKMIQLPCGKYDGVRFDIDGLYDCLAWCTLGGWIVGIGCGGGCLFANGIPEKNVMLFP